MCKTFEFRVRTKRRIIDELRHRYGGVWTYEWPSIWKNAEGWEVQGFSTCSIDVGGGEHYGHEYRRSDTNELVYL